VASRSFDRRLAADFSRLEDMNAELHVIRAAVAPGVPHPAKGTDTDSTALDR
jgi:hypothetical protein